MFEKIKNSTSRCHIFIGTDLKQVKDVLDSIYLSDKTGNVIYVQSTRDLTSARIGTESVYIQCIDAFLSPAKQRTIIQELYAMYPKAKIICGTNSPFIVNSVDNAMVYNIETLEGRLTNPFDGYQNILINQFNCGIVEFDKTGGELGEELFDLIRSKTVTSRLKELVGLVRQSSNRFLISKLEMLLLDYKIDMDELEAPDGKSSNIFNDYETILLYDFNYEDKFGTNAKKELADLFDLIREKVPNITKISPIVQKIRTSENESLKSRLNFELSRNKIDL